MRLEQDAFNEVIADGQRLAALQNLDVLDSPSELGFDRIAELIKLIFDVEIGIVSMIDAHRQWYKSVIGLASSEASLDSTFCRYTLQLGRPVIVPDATKDDRFYNNPHVTDGPKIRFYAGAPITTQEGLVIGTVCAIDKNVREFGDRETAILTHLAAIVMRELELRREAATDVLTGASSRRAFKDEVKKHLSLAKRHVMPLSCIALDIDHFKRVNDTYGHAAGDQVLAGMVNALRTTLRQSDFIGRVGGEEFAILLPQTELATAISVAEKLRLLVKELRFPGSNPPIAVSASFGVSAMGGSDDIETLLNRADHALYQAKRSGRDRVCSASAPNEAERTNRRRVLKAGQIIFNEGRSTYDCTVRSLWDNGAEIAVSLPAVVPEHFVLLLRGSAEKYNCSLANRTATSVEARFANSA
jgi:diguanylate cyclase (GGDEF)-like protein